MSAAHKKAAPGGHLVAASQTAFNTRNLTPRTALLEAAGARSSPDPLPRHALAEAAVLRESSALFDLREAIEAVGLTDFAAGAIFDAASSFAKASAGRILAERRVWQ